MQIYVKYIIKFIIYNKWDKFKVLEKKYDDK